MNRKALILMFVALIICSLSVKGETTMELLINKDWHEVNPYDYQPREDYYVRYTGTQRMIVGEDEDGNMKVRLQEYFSKLPHPSMSRWQRWYFTDSLFLSVDFNYDVVNKHWETKIDSKEFYLSEWVHHNFALTEMKKKHKNGRYINFYKMAIVSTPIAHLRTHNIWKVKRRQRFTKNMEKRSYAYEIKLLTDNLFSYSTVPMEFNPHNRFYERGIPTNRILKYTLVCD